MEIIIIHPKDGKEIKFDEKEEVWLTYHNVLINAVEEFFNTYAEDFCLIEGACWSGRIVYKSAAGRFYVDIEVRNKLNNISVSAMSDVIKDGG